MPQIRFKRKKYIRRDELLLVGDEKLLEAIANNSTLSLCEMESSTNIFKLKKSDFKLLLRLCKLKKKPLGERESQCIYLRYWQQLTFKEVAKLLNVSQGTVARSIGDAKKKIKYALKTL